MQQDACSIVSSSTAAQAREAAAPRGALERAEARGRAPRGEAVSGGLRGEALDKGFTPSEQTLDAR